MDMSDYLAAPLQLDKICRVCLTQKSDMSPLYDACLDEMLNSFTINQVKQDDGLPSQLCKQCVLQCSNAYTFKQLVDKSDSILHEFMKPEFQDPVMPISFKIEVGEECEVDKYAEMARNHIKNEIESEFVSCTDLDFKSALDSIEQDEDNEQKLNVVRVEAFSAPKQPQTSKEHKCQKCGAIFSLQIDLKTHLIKHSKKYTRICTVCNKTFANASHLKRHSFTHLDKKPHQCDQCDMNFAQKINLERHKKKHTHLFSCNECSEQFMEAESLNVHVQLHKREHPYSCDICLKSFKNHNQMQIHNEMHDKNPFNCETCGKAYSTSYALKYHQLVHTGEKPFKCETCGKCFTWTKSLIAHMVTHTRVRSFFCDVCGKGFYNSGNLAGHMRTHSGVKTHVCIVCDKMYASPNGLKWHMRSHLNGIGIFETCSELENEPGNEAELLKSESDPLK